MKQLVGLAVAIAPLLAPGVASAQPSAEAPQPDPARETLPTAYVTLGATMGIDGLGLYLDPSVNIGRRMSGPWWAHGFVTAGGNVGGNDDMAGSRYEAGAGAEARPCAFEGAACVYGGMDLAVRDVVGKYDHVNSASLMLVEHTGIDLGSRKLRLRAGLSAREDGHSQGSLGIIAGLGLESSLAYQF